MCGSRPKLVTGLGLHADNEEGEQRRLLVAGASAGTEALQLGAAVLSDGRAARCDHAAIARGMQAFVKARCNQCHAIAGHGINIGPDLTETGKRLKGLKLLQQILEPSSEINKKYQTTQFLIDNGKVLSGVVVKETDSEFHIIGNLLIPSVITKVAKGQIDEQFPSTISAMQKGMANVLTRPEIIDLVSFLETGFNLPEHLKHKHMHHSN